MMWDTVVITVVIACCGVGVLATALRLPGTWLIVAAALALGWWDGWARLSPYFVGLLAVIALVGEGVELLSSVFTVRTAGASKRAARGGLIGGIVGMFLFSIPIPVLGTIIGALLGCFAGAMIAELTVRPELRHGARIGLFSVAGFVVGTVAKLAVAFGMAGLLITTALCSPGGNAPIGPNLLGPSPTPTTMTGGLR
ncbi:MAG: DUF456 domain-containing protein [Phycisphaerae bacterium]